MLTAEVLEWFGHQAKKKHPDFLLLSPLWGSFFFVKTPNSQICCFNSIRLYSIENFMNPTPPKFNMEPENNAFQMDFPFPGTYFQVNHVKFRGVFFVFQNLPVMPRIRDSRVFL